MRVFSYLFHGLLTLFLLGISVVALSSGQTLTLEMLPWQGPALPGGCWGRPWRVWHW